MKIKKSILVLFIIAMIGIFAGCTAKENNLKTPVKVGFFPNITHAQALVGKDQGKYEKALGEKYSVQWNQFSAGSSQIAALLTGAVDIGYIGPGPAINAYISSRGDIQIISGAAGGGAVLVSRNGLTIKSVNELNGRKVAVPQYGNTQDLFLRKLLQENGLKDKTKGGTVEIVQAENPDIKFLLCKGDIDAALVPEPWGSRLVKEVGANIALDFNQIWTDENYATAVIVVRKEFLQEHPEVVEKFLRTHVELTNYINENKEESKKIINKQVEELTKKSLPEDVLDNSFKRLILTNNPQKKSIDEMVKLLVNTGILKQQPDTKSLFNLELLNRILKEKGQQQIQ